MTKRESMTWGDAFADVLESSRPNNDRAALAAAYFADLIEVVNAERGLCGRHAIGADDMAEAA